MTKIVVLVAAFVMLLSTVSFAEVDTSAGGGVAGAAAAGDRGDQALVEVPAYLGPIIAVPIQHERDRARD